MLLIRLVVICEYATKGVLWTSLGLKQIVDY